MTKVNITYRAAEGDPVQTLWRGQTFVKDKPIELDDEIAADKELIAAAATNPSFDVGDVSKAELRAQEARKRDIERAEAELASIEAAGEAMEKQQATEMSALEAEHQRERDAFQNTNEPVAIALRRVIRGSDGSDDLQPLDDKLPSPEQASVKDDATATADTPPVALPPTEPTPPEPPAPPAASGGEPVKAEPQIEQ